MKLSIHKKKCFADLRWSLSYIFDLFRLYILKPNNEIGYYNLLLSIAIAAKPSLILELGTGPGLSSLAFVRALQYYRIHDRSDGVLHTCDMDPKAISQLERWVRFDSHIVPHVMSTDELSLEWCKHATPIDFLYIDADHSHKQSLADFEHFWPYVTPDGLVLMHDTFPLSEMHEQSQYSGTVWKTIRHIKEHYSDECEIVTIPHLCGVTIMRKRGAKYF